MKLAIARLTDGEHSSRKSIDVEAAPICEVADACRAHSTELGVTIAQGSLGPEAPTLEPSTAAAAPTAATLATPTLSASSAGLPLSLHSFPELLVLLLAIGELGLSSMCFRLPAS